MDELDRLKKIAQGSADKIGESAVFLGLCTDNYTKDPECLIQLSLAVLMDKPLFLLIAKGPKVSKNLIRILEGYEFYNPDDENSFKEASEKLMAKIKARISFEN